MNDLETLNRFIKLMNDRKPKTSDILNALGAGLALLPLSPYLQHHSRCLGLHLPSGLFWLGSRRHSWLNERTFSRIGVASGKLRIDCRSFVFMNHITKQTFASGHKRTLREPRLNVRF